MENVVVKKALFVVGMCAIVSGCATSNVNYSPAQTNSVGNEVEVAETFEVVWDRLIKNLSADFFVINNVEKASRIINVSFNTNNPEQYVDCGITRRTFENVRGKQNYEYLAAASAHFTTINSQNGVAFNVYRQTKLDGRANIYVAPSNTGGTVVRANTKYALNISINYTNLAGQPAGVQAAVLDFSTKEPYKALQGEEGNPPVVCVSKGTLEDKILRYVRP